MCEAQEEVEWLESSVQGSIKKWNEVELSELNLIYSHLLAYCVCENQKHKPQLKN